MTHKFLSLTFLAMPLLFSRLPAQPSGGPYGPQTMDYPVPDSGTVYHVAPHGNPDAKGVSDGAPTTLESAIRRAATGDTLVLRGGTYRTGDMWVNQGISIQPYRDETPVLKGSMVADDWQRQGTGLWRTQWKHLFPAQPESWWKREKEEKYTPVCLFNNDMVFLDGQFLRTVSTLDQVDQDSFYIDYGSGHVYIGADPTSRLVEITAFDNAFTWTTGLCRGRHPDGKGPRIRGIRFTHYAYRALEFEGRDPEGISDENEHGKDIVGTLLENCELSFCSRVGGYFRGDNLVIRNCLVSDTSTEGIFILSSSDVLLERNIFRRNNIEQITGYYPAAVKIFNQCYRVVCRDNLVIEQPYSNGIWYDVGNVDGLILDNWFQDVGIREDAFLYRKSNWPMNAFFFEISKRAICSGNVFVDCAQGMLLLNSSDVMVHNNTFVNSLAGVGRTTRGMAADHFGWHPTTGPAFDERDGHVFANNLLFGSAEYEKPLLSIWQSGDLELADGRPQLATMDHNAYVRDRIYPRRPLLYLSPVSRDPGNAEFYSIEEVHSSYPGIALKSLEVYTGTTAFFRSLELLNFEVLNKKVLSMPVYRLPAGPGNAKPWIGAYPSGN